MDNDLKIIKIPEDELKEILSFDKNEVLMETKEEKDKSNEQRTEN